MLRQALILALAACVVGGCTTEERYPLESSLRDFNGSDPHSADSAYMELFRGGAASIPLLLEGAERQEPFAGTAYRSPSASVLPVVPPTQGVVALYLVEAIRSGHERPHGAPVVLDASGAVAADGQKRAAEAYRAWWRSLPARDLPTVRSAPEPFSGSGLRWH